MGNEFHIVIDASNNVSISDLKQIWEHRYLVRYLVWRDIKLVFTRTGLGIFWMVIQPLATVIVVSIVLGIFVKVPSTQLPYSLLVISGLVSWSYFSLAVTKACYSFIGNASLLTKVYFPRIITPIVPAIATLIDYFVLVIITLILSIILGYLPNWSWLFLIVIMALNFLLTLGVGLWLSALNVKYRDVGNLLPVLLLIGNYLSPTLYPSSLVPEEYFYYYAANPMVGLMDATRWALFQTTPFPTYAFVFTVIFSIVMPITGFIYFQKRSSAIIDIV